MNDTFKDALQATLKHEGGYNDVKGDAGGATNFGISLRYLKDLYKICDWVDVDGNGFIDSKDIKDINEEQAAKIYYTQFWLKNKCDLIKSPEIAAKLFDMSVNMGPVQAGKLLQRATNKHGFYKLTIDGVIGNASINAINTIEPSVLYKLFIKECANFYLDIVTNNPTNMKFLKGWMNRLLS